jgi:hypothetical protein
VEGPQGAALDFVGELGEYSLTVREALHNSSFQHRIVRLSRSLQERGGTRAAAARRTRRGRVFEGRGRGRRALH